MTGIPEIGKNNYITAEGLQQVVDFIRSNMSKMSQDVSLALGSMQSQIDNLEKNRTINVNVKLDKTVVKECLDDSTNQENH